MTFAKGKLNEDAYDKVSDSIPGIDNVVERADELDVVEEPLTSMTGVEESFVKLGMEKEMVNKFVPEVIRFAEQNGGPDVGNLLKGIF
jgi:hypothetical protein